MNKNTENNRFNFDLASLKAQELKAQELGFTLIELMFTLFIASILIVISVGGFSSIVEANRVDGAINNFASDIATSRSEAIKTGFLVYMKSDGTTAAQGWHSGHEAWVERSGNTAFDDPGTSIEEGEDIRFIDVSPRSDNVSIKAVMVTKTDNGDTTYSTTETEKNIQKIIFSPEGFLSMKEYGGVDVTYDVRFKICSDDKCKTVEVSPMGRLKQIESD